MTDWTDDPARGAADGAPESATEPPPEGPSGRDAHGRFAAGNTGRPRGARNLISARAARTVLRDFEAHQEDLLVRMRRWFLPQYMQMVGRLMPRAGEEGVALEALREAEAAAMLGDLRLLIARIEAGEATLTDLETAFATGGDSGGKDR
ncbi:MAG TPA: hypothetical protein VFE13_07460 [Caulobacteraceae bacterium]|jgi:hypothetical protein|nr:hypothetical protein [Caulobacteraceae bacterium]